MDETRNDITESYHLPVMPQECMELLNIRPDGIYLDGTMGGAGHSSEILKRLGKGGVLIGIDQDDEALKEGAARLEKVQTEGKFVTVKSNFSDMTGVTEELKAKGIIPDGRDGCLDGILLDIGVSSHQFDSPERGFSYRFDSKLDMRMDRTQELSAYEIVNGYSQEKLTGIIKEYGEEPWAAKISREIVRARTEKPVETTFQLVDIIKKAIPERARQGGGHPAKKTFQALRIEVNRELEVLEKGIENGLTLLKDGGRFVIITFHSLEDRIVKNSFRKAQNPCTCPPSFPVCVCGKISLGTVVTGKPVTASQEELEVNNRSHSAKVRAFERQNGR